MSTNELPLTAEGALSVWKMNPAKGSRLNLYVVSVDLCFSNKIIFLNGAIYVHLLSSASWWEKETYLS